MPYQAGPEKQRSLQMTMDKNIRMTGCRNEWERNHFLSCMWCVTEKDTLKLPFIFREEHAKYICKGSSPQDEGIKVSFGHIFLINNLYSFCYVPSSFLSQTMLHMNLCSNSECILQTHGRKTESYWDTKNSPKTLAVVWNTLHTIFRMTFEVFQLRQYNSSEHLKTLE